jgi:hypothetical protein
MKYILNPKHGLIELTINKANISKNKIENNQITLRACGDCKRFLDINEFDSRVRNEKRQIHTKCILCLRIRKLIKNSINRFEKNSSTEKIIGISYADFIRWLDQVKYKHTDKGLHIDHCIPQSLGENAGDLTILNHYSNLKLLQAKENILKSNKFITQEDLNRVLRFSLNPERLKHIISQSKIPLF